MGARGRSGPFHDRCGRLLLHGCVWLLLGLLTQPARGLDYPWVLLNPKNDSRDAEMQDEDEAQSRNMVAVMNRSEELFDHHLIWEKSDILNLLKLHAPFCEMHFDAVRPFWLTAEEKKILGEYLKRGGFILFFIDAYPYSEQEFWPVKQWPIIDFITKELPASDPDFTVGRATDAFPIFTIHYHTQTADVIRHELSGNPHTCNRTLLFHQGRLCCFVMGQYTYLEDGAWVPEPRPFTHIFSPELKSYKLIVNIYTYSVAR
jgi:hypothetical protein